jgi:hypothetical protein
VRLGGFLVVRVWKTGHDSRFDEAKHKPFKFWIYWTMQVRTRSCATENRACYTCQSPSCQLLRHHPGHAHACLNISAG